MFTVHDVTATKFAGPVTPGEWYPNPRVQFTDTRTGAYIDMPYLAFLDLIAAAQEWIAAVQSEAALGERLTAAEVAAERWGTRP